MFVRLFLPFILSVYSLPIFSQSFQLVVKGGITTGTPFGKIPKGATGSPGLGPVAQIGIAYALNDRMNIQATVGYSRKGSNYFSPIEGNVPLSGTLFGIPIKLPFDASYTGEVEGVFDNTYIDLPLTFRYQLGKNTYLLGGPQFSWLMRPKLTGVVDLEVFQLIPIRNQDFDDSEYIHPHDYGILLGMERRLIPGLFFGSEAYVGMRSVYKKGYENADGTIRNMYLQMYVSYRL